VDKWFSAVPLPFFPQSIYHFPSLHFPQSHYHFFRSPSTTLKRQLE
jgi:hypothetical protein